MKGNTMTHQVPRKIERLCDFHPSKKCVEPEKTKQIGPYFVCKGHEVYAEESVKEMRDFLK
jgi:hypothetical protein